MAGGGVKPGITYGATDELGYHVAENKVHVHDLQATILHCLGLDHTKLTYQFQGRDYRLTDVHGEVVKGLLGVICCTSAEVVADIVSCTRTRPFCVSAISGLRAAAISRSIDKFLDELERASFLFFWESADPKPGSGQRPQPRRRPGRPRNREHCCDGLRTHGIVHRARTKIRAASRHRSTRS